MSKCGIIRGRIKTVRPMSIKVLLYLPTESQELPLDYFYIPRSLIRKTDNKIEEGNKVVLHIEEWFLKQNGIPHEEDDEE